MEKVLLIVLLVLSVLSLLFSVLALLHKEKSGDPGRFQALEKSENEHYVEMKTLLSSLSDSFADKTKAMMENESKNQLLELKNNLSTQAEVDNRRLRSFEEDIQTNLNGQIALINDRIDSNLSNMQKTLADQSKMLETGLREQSEKSLTRLDGFEKTVNERLSTDLQTISEKVNQSLTKGFEDTTGTMNELEKELVLVKEAQKNIDGLNQEITNLNGILSNNQQRGKYGEWQLELLLDNMFPESKGILYDTQYVLENAKEDNGTLKPDAVIFLDGKAHHHMVCIDSKFSLTGYEALFDQKIHLSEEEQNKAKANFRTALKNRVNETSKYVLPGKTISSALMFIPNDGVFAFVHNTYPDLLEYARKHNVTLVSPSILQPLLASFHIIQIDEKKSANLEKINQVLNALGENFARFAKRWEDLSKTINQLGQRTSQFSVTVNKIDKQFTRVKEIDFSAEEKSPKELKDGDIPVLEPAKEEA